MIWYKKLDCGEVTRKDLIEQFWTSLLVLISGFFLICCGIVMSLYSMAGISVCIFGAIIVIISDSSISRTKSLYIELFYKHKKSGLK